jgi:hypothetical protein
VIPIRVIAIPTAIAETVRSTNQAPRYGHPAHTELASGYGPCRHCLRTFHIGQERRTLFTYDPFDGIEKVPLPGPIFIHTDPCTRYPEEAGYPADLRKHAAVLSAYARGQRLIAQTHVDDDDHDAALEQLLKRADVDYVEVRDKLAGCYDFRVERVNSSAAG